MYDKNTITEVVNKYIHNVCLRHTYFKVKGIPKREKKSLISIVVFYTQSVMKLEDINAERRIMRFYYVKI